MSSGSTLVSEVAIERFLRTLYSQVRAMEVAAGDEQSLGNAFLTAIPFPDGPSGGTGERRLCTRSLQDAIAHAQRWNRPDWSVYVGVNLLDSRARERSKGSVAWIVCAHCDLDLKNAVWNGIQPNGTEVMTLLAELGCRPSMIVHSGNGFHLYWILEEPIPATPENIERIEAINGRIAQVVAGDFQNRDVSRILRLPGTHNAKGGAWKPVQILETTGELFTPQGLEDWLAGQPVVISAREGSGPPALTCAPVKGVLGQTEAAEANPFLKFAAEVGLSTPIDVEQRLAQMTFQGTGDTSIHQTQVDCSASMLSSGMAIEDVVGTLLEATRTAAGPAGAKWNWKNEEKALRTMCATWVKKNPELAETARPPVVSLADKRRATARPEGDAQIALDKSITEQDQRLEVMSKVAGGNGSANVLDFGGKVPAPAAAPAKGKGKSDQHIKLASVLVMAMREQGEDLVVMADQMWHYTDGLWAMAPLDGQRWLARQIEIAAAALEIKTDNRLINETRGWLIRSDLFRNEVAWDEHGLVPTRSGLLEYRTGEVLEAGPDHYATWRVEAEYVPGAACPWWLRMLEDAFADLEAVERTATIGLLQEIAGMSLLEDKPKALSKALVLQGGSDSGKTQLLAVLGGLTSAQPISTTFDTLANPHGLMEFSRRAPWVLHEAFDQGKWHLSSTVKSLLTGDPVQINIKGGPLVTRRVRCPVFWGTNHPPSFKEATKAIVNRLIVIKCRRTFDERSPTGAALEATRQGWSEPAELVLATEREGLLNWAIEGLQRAMARGYFILPDEVVATRAEIRTDSNLVAGFVEECCVFEGEGMVAMPDFGAAFDMWWRENKGENASSPSNDSVGRAIAALGDQRLGTERDSNRRYILGLHLNPNGRDYWRAARDSTIAAGKTSRISDEDEVNRAIPGAWSTRESVARIRAAFGTKNEA